MTNIYNMNEYREINGYRVTGGRRRNTRRRKKKGCGGCLISFLFIVCVCVAIFILLDKAGILPQVADVNLKRIPFQEIQVNEEDLTDKYYYGQLGEEEQRAYKELVQGIENQDMKIYVHLANGDRAMELFQYVLNDHPEFFWCSGQVQGLYYDSTALQSGYTEVQPVYTYSLGERKAKQQEIDDTVHTIMEGIDADATEYERVRYTFEYIVKNTDYNLQAEDNQNIVSVFVNRQSVCAGYARANQYLLQRMGIFCIYVVGTAKADNSEQAHAWNIVKIGNDYYNVDVTWGDPVFQSSSENHESMADYIYHDYLCCTDTFMEATHSPQEGITYPSCESDDCNYYKLNGSYYERYDKNEALASMKKSIEKKENYTDFQFASNEEFEKAKTGFQNGVMKEAAQYLAGRYGLLQVAYNYQWSEETNRITMFWQYQ